MRIKKVRGHKRRQREIQEWINYNLPLNKSGLIKWQREYTKIRIYPWGGISITESAFPEPSGKTKAMMLSGLLDIYQSWKRELDQLNQPYYLKIWLFEPWFSKSQVVCAIENRRAYYENLFRRSDKKRDFKPENYGGLGEKLSHFSWELAFDDEVSAESEFDVEPERYAIYEDWLYDQRRFRNMKKNPRTTIIEGGEDVETLYFVPKGYVWLGETK